MQNYYQQAVKIVDFPEPREPDTDDSQEAWENYQIDVDKYPKRFKEKVTALAEKLRGDDERALLEKDDDAVYRIYESEVINRLAQERMGSSFYDMCLYVATLLDDKFKHRAFESFEAFKNTHPKLKEILKEHYQSLELGTDLLKKLPGVTVSP